MSVAFDDWAGITTLSGLTEMLSLKNELFVSATLSSFPGDDGYITIGNEIITHRFLVQPSGLVL